jgi:hypothetical protein
MSEIPSLFQYRAAFTAPSGQGVHFHWFEALDDDDATRIATEYASRSLFADWSLSLWKPEHLNV